jgi:hypothetical protein
VGVAEEGGERRRVRMQLRRRSMAPAASGVANRVGNDERGLSDGYIWAASSHLVARPASNMVNGPGRNRNMGYKKPKGGIPILVDDTILRRKPRRNPHQLLPQVQSL